MVQTLLPRDAHNQSIQTMAPVAADSIAIGAATTAKATDFTAGVKVVELRPTAACFIAFGGGSVVATTGDFYLHADERVTYHIGVNSRVAVIRSVGDGTLYLTELA